MNSNDFNFRLYSYKDSLQSFAISFTRDVEDANDLVQDTMLKAINYSGHFKEGTNFKAWLYTIMKNTFINNYRRATKTNSIMTVTDEITSDKLHYSATVNDGDGKFVMEDIHKALAKLQPEYYTPFLKYFEGFKYHEIAVQLDIPIGTVKTRIHLARQLLKKKLKMYEDSLSPKLS
ncbi:RNA polymerase sigma factor [Pedobacter cryoconitis]|uniref:RNA polymerase sigma-70 factor (ECF subfamily) n=1 Tax=Pedobacter cryoconitis TaxID=188932 RepID=A0A7X0J6I2_9SPHI|nr:sigma-70 family RNA polymerase sigma factor [Pedobacter cryoconitis]MBB6501534.1 RNA polymerase sigma-70 factor (ECF subfamily) [Pedobacter cryoconitis]